MNKKELLVEAYRRFPIGTKFKSSFDDNDMIREIKPYAGNKSVIFKIEPGVGGDVNTIVIRCDNGISDYDDGCSNPSIYKDGVWVSVISNVDPTTKRIIIEKTFPRDMLVWDDNESEAIVQTIDAYVPSLISPYITKSPECENGSIYFGYKNAKEYDEKDIFELTLEDIATLKNVNVNQIRIKV